MWVADAGKNEKGFAKGEALILALAVAAGTFLRFYRLAGQSLWLDEVLQAWICDPENPIRDVFTKPMASAAQPPLSYLIEHLFLHIDKSDLMVRLPHAIFGVLSIPAIYFLARGFLGRSVAALGALVLALSPYHLYYSQEARPYAALCFFIILALGFFVRAVRYDRPRDWILFAVFSTASIWTNILTAYVLAAALVVAFVGAIFHSRVGHWAEFKRSHVLKTLIVLVVVLVTAIPIAQAVKANREKFASNDGGGSAVQVLSNAGEYVSKRTPRDLEAFGKPAAALFVGLWLLGIIAARREGSTALFLVGFSALPYLIHILHFSYLDSHRMHPRYVIYAYPMFCLAAARGLDFVTSRRSWWPAPTLLTLVCVPALYQYYAEPTKPDLRSVASYLESRVDDHSVIVVNHWLRAPSSYYFNRVTNPRTFSLEEAITTALGPLQSGLHEVRFFSVNESAELPPDRGGSFTFGNVRVNELVIRRKQAKEDLNEAIGLYERDVATLSYPPHKRAGTEELVKAYFAIEDWSYVVSAARWHLSLEQNNLEILELLGRACLEMGDIVQARQTLNRLRRIAPDDPVTIRFTRHLNEEVRMERS